MECAQEICPKYNASLACVPDLKSNQEIKDMLSRTDQGDVWIGIYSDPEKPFGDGSQDATLNSWTSGCSSSFRGGNRTTDPYWARDPCGPGCYSEMHKGANCGTLNRRVGLPWGADPAEFLPDRWLADHPQHRWDIADRRAEERQAAVR